MIIIVDMTLFIYCAHCAALFIKYLVDHWSHEKEIVLILYPMPISNTILFIYFMYVKAEIKTTTNLSKVIRQMNDHHYQCSTNCFIHIFHSVSNKTIQLLSINSWCIKWISQINVLFIYVFITSKWMVSIHSLIQDHMKNKWS